MGLLRAILKLPFILWFFIFGAYMYFQYNNWQNDVYNPLTQQLEVQKQKLASLKKENKEAETFGKEKDERVQELQHLAEDFNHALEKLPRSSDIPGVLTALADISDRVGLEFSRFEPGKPQLNGYLMETPFKVELRGTFVQIMSFLDEVAHLKRIIVSKSVSFKDGQLRGNNTLMKAEATLVTYHFDENAKPDTAPNTPGANLNRMGPANPSAGNNATAPQNSSTPQPNETPSNASPNSAPKFKSTPGPGGAQGDGTR